MTMAWIPYLDEPDADPPLDRIYESRLDPESGKVDHILKIHGPTPLPCAATR